MCVCVRVCVCVGVGVGVGVGVAKRTRRQGPPFGGCILLRASYQSMGTMRYLSTQSVAQSRSAKSGWRVARGIDSLAVRGPAPLVNNTVPGVMFAMATWLLILPLPPLNKQDWEFPMPTPTAVKSSTYAKAEVMPPIRRVHFGLRARLASHRHRKYANRPVDTGWGTRPEARVRVCACVRGSVCVRARARVCACVCVSVSVCAA